MMFMNQYDIEDMLNAFDEDTNLVEGARTLYRLMEWTNRNSDGWAYWPKPARAAKRLMELLQEAEKRHRGGDYADVERKALTQAFTPIKAFLTRQNVEHSEVFYIYI